MIIKPGLWNAVPDSVNWLCVDAEGLKYSGSRPALNGGVWDAMVAKDEALDNPLWTTLLQFFQVLRCRSDALALAQRPSTFDGLIRKQDMVSLCGKASLMMVADVQRQTISGNRF